MGEYGGIVQYQLTRPLSDNEITCDKTLKSWSCLGTPGMSNRQDNRAI